MDARYPQSVLVATALSSGFRDGQRLARIITERAGSEPNFWSEYLQRARSAASRLITTARSCRDQDLLEGYSGVTEAMREMAPFVVAAPAALDVLTRVLAAGVAEETLPMVVTPWQDPDPVCEMRSGYQIALEVFRDEKATELFRTTSPSIALGRVKEEFPELYQSIHNHVDEYGWLRTRGYRYQPLTPESLVYRMQLMLIRWPVETVREAAQPNSVPVADGILGFVPSATQAEQIAAVQAIVTERAFRADVLLQAECIARPFLARVAESLGCTLEQVLFSSTEEVVAALSSQWELQVGEIDGRIRDASPRNGNHGVTGMTACRGTAVGRVRIVLDQDQLLELQIGDVLVTGASTIDHTDPTGDNPTVFPTRHGGPHGDALGKAAAVVADEGGLLSHAAIVCRERGLTCVLGTDVGTSTLVDGQVVEVDATKTVGFVIPLGTPA